MFRWLKVLLELPDCGAAALSYFAGFRAPSPDCTSVSGVNSDGLVERFQVSASPWPQSIVLRFRA
jgi:hypothetical protein